MKSSMRIDMANTNSENPHVGRKFQELVKSILESEFNTYKKLQKEKKNRPCSIEEMMLYDEIFDED